MVMHRYKLILRNMRINVCNRSRTGKDKAREAEVPVQLKNEGKSCEALYLLREDSLVQMHSLRLILLASHSWKASFPDD